MEAEIIVDRRNLVYYYDAVLFPGHGMSSVIVHAVYVDLFYVYYEFQSFIDKQVDEIWSYNKKLNSFERRDK